jgi:hypothetical protein
MSPHYLVRHAHDPAQGIELEYATPDYADARRMFQQWAIAGQRGAMTYLHDGATIDAPEIMSARSLKHGPVLWGRAGIVA